MSLPTCMLEVGFVEFFDTDNNVGFPLFLFYVGGIWKDILLLCLRALQIRLVKTANALQNLAVTPNRLLCNGGNGRKKIELITQGWIFQFIKALNNDIDFLI